METIEKEVTKYNLPQVLFDLHRNKKTGTLTVGTPGITKRIFFNRGNAIFASSTSEDDRLGETLVKLGQITHEQYEKSVELLKETGKKQGAILVELGYLTPKDLILGVQYQVREIIYSLFRLKDAEYEFEEEKIPSNEVITLQMSMGKLIYEGLKRNNNLSMIRRELPGMQAILQQGKNTSDLLKDIVLSPQDEAMLSSVDGTKTVGELISSFSSNSFEALKSLYVLHTIGFIEELKEADNEAVKNEEEDEIPSGTTENLYPEIALLNDEPTQKPFHFASSDMREDLSPNGHGNVQSESEKWWNVNTVEAEASSETIHEPVKEEEKEKEEDVDEIRDRRRHKRFKVEGAEVNGEMLFRKEVKVLDMSISGIALQTDRQLKIGKGYLLNLQNQDKIISIRAIVVRSTLSESKTDSSGDVIPLYLVGMQFTNLSDEKINQIIEFIDNHKAGDQPKPKTNGKMEHRKSTRFEMNVDGKTILNFHELYKVKVISLNGMLIDSSHFLNIEDKLHMKIILPEDQAIDFVGRVASCSEKGEGDQKRYDIGVEFIEMPDEHREKLKEFFKNIEDIRKCDISAVQTESAGNEETSASHSLNTGDADLYILQGKYSDAMAIYHELLSKEPENVHVLKRIEALSTLVTTLKDEKERPPRESGAIATETVQGRNRKADGKPFKNGSARSNKSRENVSPSRWYRKFLKRIIPAPSANSNRF